MTLSHPAAVMGRLAEIESDLAGRQNEYEDVADKLARVKREWDKRMATALVGAKGSSKELREAEALLAILAAGDDIYERLTDAEARYSALKVVTGSLSERASIGQSILKAQTRA